MTVVHPNAVSGINSITVQSGNSLSIHKADGSLIRTITGSTGVTTFATVSVGTGWTDFAQGGGLNIGLGASISNGSGNVLTFGTGGDDRATIAADGKFLLGHTSSVGVGREFQTSSISGYGGMSINRFSADSGSGGLDFVKSRNASLGGNTIVQSGDAIGAISFKASDGSDFETSAAQIKAEVDGTPGANDMPGRLVFKTTADGANSLTERLRITAAGALGIAGANYGSSGQVLTSGGSGAAISWSTISGTTINNNANNRLITGSGTANTLEAESGLTYDQDTLSLTRSANAAGGVYVYNSNNSQASAIAQVYISGGDNAYGSLQLECNGTNHSIRQDGNGHLKFFNASAERVRITNGGDVGIGNDSPSCKLAIKDTATHTAYAGLTPSVGDCMLAVYNNPSSEATNNHATVQFGVNGGTHNRVSTISGVAEASGNRKLSLTFCTDSGSNRNERMRIQGDGRLLLGHTSSYAVLGEKWLQVVGTSYDTSGISAMRFEDSTAGASLLLGHSRGAKGVSTILQNNDEVGKIRFAACDGQDTMQWAGGIACEIDGAPGSNDVPGRLLFYTAADGASTGTERLRITSSGSWGLAGANFGSSGQFLKSQGSGSPVVWASTTAPSIGDSDNYSGSHICMGTNAGKYTSANYKICIGYQAGQYGTARHNNVFIGVNAGRGNSNNTSSTGQTNVAIGNYAGQDLEGGSNNVLLGQNAGANITSGNGSVILGNGAGGAAVNPDDIVIIGKSSGYGLTQSNQSVIIGHGASGEALQGDAADNQLFIARQGYGGGNSGTWIYGNSSGQCTQGGGSSSWYTGSDERYKDFLGKYSRGLAEINGLDVQNFKWKDQDNMPAMAFNNAGSYCGPEIDGKTRIGVGAQSCEALIPEAVNKLDPQDLDKGGNHMLTLDNDPIFWAAINAIQELSTKIDALTTRVTALE